MACTEASHINHLWAGLVVEELVRQGAGPFFLSPGSRCTPLTIAVARHGKAVSYTHFDERGMAFHALGHAKATGCPAVLLCTSGTAAANYLPAVVEASQAHVPLVVLTADRPPELLDCGANQAIVQPGLFGSYARWAVDLPCPDEAMPPQALLTSVGHAVHRAKGMPAGPVHLNCKFREPLAPGGPLQDFASYLAPVMEWMDDERPYTSQSVGGVLPASDLDVLSRTLRDARAGLLVAGELRTGEEQCAVRDLAAKLGWPSVPDVLSGLRVGCPGPPWLPHFDQMLLSPDFASRFRPDTVLHVGGPLVSKRLQTYLEAVRPEYLRVSPHPLRHDPGHLVRQRYACDVVAVCRFLEETVGGAADPPVALSRLDAAVGDAVDRWLGEGGALDEIYLARAVSMFRPPGGVLFLGNSMPVRDMDMYATSGAAAGPVYANRGASGIDGTIATAAGVARASDGPVIAVVGDLAGLHDLNSLAILPALTRPFVLVVVNNDGGGIFSFLPVSAQSDVFEEHFATPHGWGFEHLARAFGIRYHLPASRESFEEALRQELATVGPSLIEVRTDRKENARRHRELQGSIARLVTDGLRP